ncbi:MAG: peroxiredoxin [Acidobacteriota bacterium]|nr:peroxiredoxin [Blastocatellia bacterium]MDW8238317.1 peroxiredoxin [Acidobacteriota bacterium]
MFTWWSLYRSVPYEGTLEELSQNGRFSEVTTVADVTNEPQQGAEQAGNRAASEEEPRSRISMRRITMITKGVSHLILLATCLGLAGVSVVWGSDGGPNVGEKAPDFRLPYATHETIVYDPQKGISLSQYRGKIVVLAFYPADWSPGCTTEVCTLRDSFRDLDKLGAVILGISGDYVFSHHEWAKHHGLTFPLLSDHDHTVAKAYASYMGPPLGYNKRTIYVIDGQGIVRYRDLEFKHDDPTDYEMVRKVIEKLKSSQS